MYSGGVGGGWGDLGKRKFPSKEISLFTKKAVRFLSIPWTKHPLAALFQNGRGGQAYFPPQAQHGSETLADSSVSVQIEEPYCCEIEQLVLENAVTCFGFTFCGVPTECMEGLCGRVQEVLAGLCEGRRELDMQRMHTIIKNQMLQILNQVRGQEGWGRGELGDHCDIVLEWTSLTA